MNDLFHGRYFVKETKAPEGFVLDTGVSEVMIDTNGKTYELENKAGVGFINEAIPMYCSNCGELLYGYRNDEGKIKYECKRCGTVAVRVQKGRRHDKIDLYAPEGQVRYY